MKHLLVDRLFDSFAQLEKAIVAARVTLEQKDNPPVEVLERIQSYEDILDKQRNLATSLCGHARLGDWEEVRRHIKLINGLSAMIRDDAHEVLSGLRPSLTPVEKEAFLS